MFKILQAKLQQSLNWEFPVVYAGFRKGRGTRDQIANIHWIIEKEREFQKNIYFCFIDYAKAFNCEDHKKLQKIWRDGSTKLLGAGGRHSTCGKGHEEGASTYAKAGWSRRSPPGNPWASTPITRACLLYYFVLSPTPLTLWGAVPHHLFWRRS